MGRTHRRTLVSTGIFALAIGSALPTIAQTQPEAPFFGERSQGSDATSDGAAERPQDLYPFVGETSQDFEARKRGQAPESRPASVVVTADANGQFLVQCVLNGQPTRMVVDTGATFVSLSYADAERIGLHVSEADYSQKIVTANGMLRAAPVRVDEIRVGEILVRDIDAVVLPPGNSTLGLLGMSFLKQLKGFEISEGQLLLRG